MSWAELPSGPVVAEPAAAGTAARWRAFALNMDAGSMEPPARSPDAPQRIGRFLGLLSGATHFRQAAGIAFVFLLVALGSVFWGQRLLERLLVSHVRDMVSAEVHTQRLLGGLGSAEPLARALAQRSQPIQRRERSFAVQSARGDTLYGDEALFSPQMCASGEEGCTGWKRARLERPDGDVEMLGQIIRLRDGGRYAVAYDILPMLDRVHPIPLMAGVSIFAVLLISLGSGLYFSLDGMRHIDRIRKAMRSYAHGEQDARVPLRDRQDEFDRLGEDINKALLRITRLMDEVRNATNHIAHELRTPLTRLQNRLSNAIESADDEATRHEIALAEEEATTIQHLFRAVMRISEIETGRCGQDVGPVDTRQLLLDLADYYRWSAEERGTVILVRADPGCIALGDRALLFQALVNLIDNAFKYAPPGGSLELIARRVGHVTELCVADEGPGIDRARRAEAVQRFRRFSKDRRIPGHGLGLALVQAVAELHAGSFELHDNQRPASTPGSAPGLLAVVRIDNDRLVPNIAGPASST